MLFTPLSPPVAAPQGTILIAVNPLQRVPSPDMADYMDRPLNPEAPHPYAIAEVSNDTPPGWPCRR